MIKWDNVDIMVTPFDNEIKLCKSKPVKGYPGLMEATDMSGDKTEKCIKAVMQHMMNCCINEKANIKTFLIPGVCKLELTDLRDDKEDEII